MNKIKLLRSKRDLSQSELAKNAGVGVVTIIRLESGGKAYLATLMKVAEALEVDLEELLEFEASGPNKGKAKPAPKPTPPPLPPASEQEPVKPRFIGQNKDNLWKLHRELGLSLSTVRNYMMKLPDMETMTYEELEKLVATKFKKGEKE